MPMHIAAYMILAFKAIIDLFCSLYFLFRHSNPNLLSKIEPYCPLQVMGKLREYFYTYQNKR